MEALAFMVLGGIIVAAYFTLKKKQGEDLTPAEQTNPVARFVHFKKRILTTSAYDQESTYELLHEKVAQLTQELILRHAPVLIDSAAKSKVLKNFGTYFEHENGGWRIRRDLDIRGVDGAVLLVLALMSYFGCEIYRHATVSKNRFFANRAIEWLIQNRNWRATLAKALIHKYGFQEYLPPDTATAESLLSDLAGAYPNAFAERQDLGALGALEQFKPQRGIHPSMLWRSHSELEELIRAYHPANVNG